jgi:hypothetical protein
VQNIIIIINDSVINLLSFLIFSLKNFVCQFKKNIFNSVAEPHHFYAALAPGKNFDATSARILQYHIAGNFFYKQKSYQGFSLLKKLL